MNRRFASVRASWWAAAGAACLAITAVLVPETALAQVTWSSTPASGGWNSGGNWAGGNAPNGTTQAIVFGNSTITTTTNTFTSGTFSGISFLAGAPSYTLGGNRLTLTGNVTNSSTVLQTIGLDFTTTAQRTTTLTAGGGNLLLSGSIGGSGGGFSTAGTGTLTLTGPNSFTGGVSIANNTTIVAGSPSALGTTAGTVTFQGTTGMTLVAAADSSLSAYPLSMGSGKTATIVSDRATPGAGITHSLGLFGLGTSTLNATAGTNVTSGTAVVGFSGINLSAGALGASTLNPTTAAITVGTINVAVNPGQGAKTIVLGGTNASNSVTGSISDNLSPVAVQKTGASTWTLSGSNSYGGGTLVNGGTLRIASNSALPAVNVNRMLNTAVAVTVSGSAAAATVDLDGVTVTGQIALSGSTNGARLVNESATAATIGDSLAGIQFSNGGTGFSTANLNQAGVITLSAGGAAARITSLAGSLDTLTLVTGGTGWAVGNRITLSGGLGNTSLIPTQAAVYTVTSVGANGVITGLAVETPGMGYVSVPTGFSGAKGTAGPAFTGTGASFTFNNSFAAAQIQTTAVGSGYAVAPTVGTSTGSGLVATAVLSGVTLSGTNNSIGGAGDLTINSVIAGSGGGFMKAGTGTLLLSASNSFTGAASVEGGTLAFDRVAALNSSSGIGINAGTILDYTGLTTGTLSRNVTVATSGTGTIRNSGGQKLTLSGTLTKDGRVLRLTGGAFDVTGQIVGSSSNSDLLVDGTSTVTLLSANTYNGPTFVNQSSNLIVGINNAIPNNSIVTLGNATTTGTLSLGSFSNAIGGLVFSGSGGALRMAPTAAQTSAVQVSATGALTLNAAPSTLDLTGMATGSGAYKLISYTSRTGTFATVTGLNSDYLLRYDTVTANEITAQRKADQASTFTMTTATVTRALINTNVTVSGTVSNSTPSGGSNLVLGLASTGLTGSGFTTGTITPGSNLAVSGLLNAGSNVGVQNWSITNTDGNAITTVSTATGSITVVNQRTFSVSNSGTINLGNFLRGTAVTGSTTISSIGLNATTANASLGPFGGGPSGFSLATLASTDFLGTSGTQSALYTLSGSAASAGAINGSFTSTVTAELGSISPVSVALVGTAYDPAIASFTTASATTSWLVDIGSFNQNTGLHTAGFDIFNLFSGDLAFAADLMLDSITPIGTPFSSLSTNLSGTAFGSLAPGRSNSWTATLNSSTVGSFTNQYQLNFVSAKNGQSLGGPQSMTLTVTGVIIVPEPGALALAGIGIAAVAYACRRRRT